MKELVGIDKYDGSLYAYDRYTDSLYRAANLGLGDLVSGLGDLGEALWEKIADTITKTGIPAALADRIKGSKSSGTNLSAAEIAAIYAAKEQPKQWINGVDNTVLMVAALGVALLFINVKK